jgi:hypothetical protein
VITGNSENDPEISGLFQFEIKKTNKTLRSTIVPAKGDFTLA